jgi:hypothetical protein
MESAMNHVPCATRLTLVVTGLAFLQPVLTATQFGNMTLIATAVLLGSGFNLSAISRMWLKERAVSTLSYFFSDAKLELPELQRRYVKHALKVYKVVCGYFLVDDTLQHHTRLCKWIHGVCVLFDHVLGTNLKAVCIVVLYYSDGVLIKFPVRFRIYYKEKGKPMPWQRHKMLAYKKKYMLAAEMLEWALELGFPRCIVLADSWYGISPFVKELKRLKLGYVLEIKVNNTVRTPCKQPKLTPSGKLAKKQYDLSPLPKYFTSISTVVTCGFERDLETGKPAKVLYQAKVNTVRLNAFPGKHRIVESLDPATQTTKYFLTNNLTWEASKILTVYSYRWVIEEFFRNAKQLTGMEGATLRSEQGVTLTLCLVFWLDFLLHRANYTQRTAGKLSQESLTIPSIVRQAQYTNLEAVIEKIQQDHTFVSNWLEVAKEQVNRVRTPRKELIALEIADGEQLRLFA